MSDTENEGVTFACEDCGSRVEDAPMRPATCVECGGAFEVVTEDGDVDLPLLLRSVDRGDEVRLRTEDGSFVRGDVRRIWHEADEDDDDDEVRLTLAGDGQTSYEVRVEAGDQLAAVTVTKVMGSGESAVRAGRDRVVGVLNLADHPDALDDHRGDRVALVGCGQKKASHPVPARQLYESAYFDKKHGYAEQDAVDAWFILSAEYGLVHPDERIEPYDTHIDDVDADEWCGLVQEQMPHFDGATIEVLAGEAYFEALDLALDFAVGTDGAVERPLEGLGIGEQMAWLKDHTGEEGAEETAENDPLTEDDIDVDHGGYPFVCYDCANRFEEEPNDERCHSCGGPVVAVVPMYGLALDGGQTCSSMNCKKPAIWEAKQDISDDIPRCAGHAAGFKKSQLTMLIDVERPKTLDQDDSTQATLAPTEDDGLQEDENSGPDDAAPGDCVAIIDTTGEPCGNSVTTEASDTPARLCGTHAKASTVKLTDAVQGDPDSDLRDQLVDAGMNGSHAYYLATIADSAADLWRLVTGMEAVEQDEKVYEPSTLATLAPTVARLDDVDAEGHPLAYDGCVALIDSGSRGENYRCGSGSYANKLLCGTHQDTKTENLRTVFDTDAPEDLRIDAWDEISIGDDQFLTVEQRDGDLLAIAIPEYEYRRLEGFGYLVDEIEDAGDARDDSEGNQSLTDNGADDVQEEQHEEIDADADPAEAEAADPEERDRLEQYLRDNYATHIGTDGGTQILMETFDSVEEFEAATFEEKLRAAGIRVPALNVLLEEYDSVVDIQYRAKSSPALTEYDGVGQDSAHVVGKCFLKWSSMGGAPPRAWNDIHPESPEIAPEDDGTDEPVDRQSVREKVLEELVPLLEAGLSPSQALDYWAVEDTDETHGAFTQQEWAEIRGVSRQAVGHNAGNARDALDDESA